MGKMRDMEKVKERCRSAEHASESPYLVRKFMSEALAELEKPADDDARECADSVNVFCVSSGWEGHDFDIDKASDIIQQYAESYHAKKCAGCAEFLPYNGPESEANA